MAVRVRHELGTTDAVALLYYISLFTTMSVIFVCFPQEHVTGKADLFAMFCCVSNMPCVTRCSAESMMWGR